VFSNNFFYVKKLLLVSLSMVLISFSFLTVFASANTPEENGFVLVIIRANVDSRVIESQPLSEWSLKTRTLATVI